jgi:environmental stress-induced protein Ves
VSLAEITETAPFSAFPGMDRTTVLVDGGPVSLMAPHQQWALSEPGHHAHYAGELSLHNTAPERDTLFWNVMTARGRVSASVDFLQDALALPEQGHSLVWVLRGACTLSGQPLPGFIHLGPQEGLHWRGGQNRLILRATEPDSLLLHTLLTE